MNRLKDINLVAVHTHSCIHTGVSRKIKSKSQYSECKATISNDGSFLVEKRGITLIALIITNTLLKKALFE